MVVLHSLVWDCCCCLCTLRGLQERGTITMVGVTFCLCSRFIFHSSHKYHHRYYKILSKHSFKWKGKHLILYPLHAHCWLHDLVDYQCFNFSDQNLLRLCYLHALNQVLRYGNSNKLEWILYWANLSFELHLMHPLLMIRLIIEYSYYTFFPFIVAKHFGL